MTSSKYSRDRSDLPPLERIKRQRAWMLPCLAALFVLNFAAFVNGRLAPAVAVVGDTSDPVFVHVDTDTRHDHKFSTFTRSDCESNTRHVHVRSIRTDPRVEKSIRIELR